MLLQLFGLTAAATLVATYALEARSPRFVLYFAAGCIAVAAYAVATDAWLFAALEALWSAIALRRWWHRTEEERP